MEKKKSFLKSFLKPLTYVWLLLTFLDKKFSSPKTSEAPVLCVGNLTIGGNGKTPSVINFQKKFIKLKYDVHVVTRGYLGSEKGPHKVNNIKDDINKVGDEALLLSRNGTTWVSKKKYKGIEEANKKEAELIILDDGFQNFSIKKNFSILVIDAHYPFGNESLFPSGPLREPIKNGIKRANLILLVGNEKIRNDALQKYPILKKKKIFFSELVQIKEKKLVRCSKYIAFAGIAKPEKFFKTLEEENYNLVKEYSLPNHKKFKENFLEKVLKQSVDLDAKLITTEKDFVRLPKKYRNFIEVLRVEMKIENEEKLIRLLIKELNICKD